MISETKNEGSARKLFQLCLGYFVFYVLTGISVKYFTGPSFKGFPGMTDMEYLVYNTIGGNLICLCVVFAFGWYRMQSRRIIQIAGFRVPSELIYIIPSGLCTAVVIPTTTLMYMLPISVMVAMVIMRGSIIVVSRIVDSILIWQGLLKKRVAWEENAAVVFALCAVAAKLFWNPNQSSTASAGHFNFLNSPAALAILASYIAAYAVRIYIMNFYRHTRGAAAPANNKAFFAFEQISSSIAIFFVGWLLYTFSIEGLSGHRVIQDFHQAFSSPKPGVGSAVFSGTFFGVVAFFSVFLFMFKGRSATFNGLVNRLTSLIAGTASTLIWHYGFGGALPGQEDWIAFGLILISIGFLCRAEQRSAMVAVTNAPRSVVGV